MTITYFDYINSAGIDNNDCVYLYKFKTLFESLKNDSNIYYKELTNSLAKKQLEDVFNSVKQDKNNFLFLINPDIDIPPIKQEWFGADDIPYTEELQKKLETIPIENFLEMDILEKIPNNLKIYCNSIIKKNLNLNMIPIGRDPKGIEYAKNSFLLNDKKILCYYNCSIPQKRIHWFGRIRLYIYENIKEKSFITCENICPNEYRDLYSNFYNYYKNIGSSKFMICPRGCSLESYRLWDCLYLGCIPIVVKYEGYSDFEDLPILFIDRWEDYLNLTEEYLTNKWNEMLNKEYNYDKLKFSWWENKIKQECV
jgi:hypothetical protein